MKSLAVSGWYGIPNIGAETILQQTLLHIRKYFGRITVFSWNPKYTEDFHKVKSIFQFSPLTVKTIKNSDCFILGGGDIIDDIGKGLIFWLSKPLLAKSMKKKVILSGVAIKRITKPTSKFLLRKILNRLDLITVRDKYSFDILSSLGIKNLHLVADPAFLLESKKPKKNLNEISFCPTSWYQQRRIWSVRKIYEPEILSHEMPKVINQLVDDGFSISFTPMQISKSGNDLTVINRILEKIQNKSEVNVSEELLTPSQTKYNLNQSRLLIGMRYHSLIFAFSSLTPTIAISCKNLPRIDIFHKEINRENFTLKVENLKSENLIKLVYKTIESKQDRKIQLKKTEYFKGLAKKNFKLIKEVIES